MIDIRPFSKADSEAFLNLARELQGYEAELYELMKPAAEIGTWYLDLLEEYSRKEDGTILIAWEDGRAIGYASIFTAVVEDGKREEVPYTYAYVGDLVVTQAARGRGIARQLLDACETYARRAGRSELRIKVLAENRRAHDVYRAFGFDNLHIDMRKKLSP
jgi:GNAT superfamily N-acetyltransferase